MFKPTTVQLEALHEFFDSAAYQVFMDVILGEVLKDQERRVLKASIASTADVHAMMIEKARYEGATKVVSYLRDLKQGLTRRP